MIDFNNLVPPVSAINDALAYAARGWQVLPLCPGAKRPLLGVGNKFATSDPAKIQKYWTDCPTANVGLALGGGPDRNNLVCVDIDMNRVNGQANWDALVAGRNVDTLTCSTARGGKHLIFKYSGFFASRINAATGIDIWGNGGQVVLPPSIVFGVRYEWLNDLPVADLPAWLLAVFDEPS